MNIVVYYSLGYLTYHILSRIIGFSLYVLIWGEKYESGTNLEKPPRDLFWVPVISEALVFTYLFFTISELCISRLSAEDAILRWQKNRHLKKELGDYYKLTKHPELLRRAIQEVERLEKKIS